MKRHTIVIIDDHPLFRQGVADTLKLEKDMNVVALAASGEEGLELIRKHQPEVAIIDVNLPGINGQQVTWHIVNEKLPTRVILLTAYDDLEQKIQSLRFGAAAYCTKDVQSEELLGTVRAVAAGEAVLARQLAQHGVTSETIEPVDADDVSEHNLNGEAFNPLSTREMEVLSHMTGGMSNKEIASLLGISHQTVKNHVSAILRKLGVEDRTQAAIYALRRGWVQLYQYHNRVQE